MHVDFCQSTSGGVGTDAPPNRHQHDYHHHHPHHHHPMAVAPTPPPLPPPQLPLNHHRAHGQQQGGGTNTSIGSSNPNTTAPPSQNLHHHHHHHHHHQPLLALHQNFNQLLNPFHHHHHNHHPHHHHPHPHQHQHHNHHHHHGSGTSNGGSGSISSSSSSSSSGRRILSSTDPTNSSTNASNGAVQQQQQQNQAKQHKSRHHHHQPVFQPDTLLDMSARIVALNIPFQIIEEKYERIPEPVQRKIIFWSFPRNEDDIKMYSSLSSESSNSTTSNSIGNNNNNNNSNSSNNNNTNSPHIYNQNNEASNQNNSNNSNNNSNTGNNGNNSSNRQNNQQRLPFYKGLKLCEEGSVFDVLQVGFHLSGCINLKTSGSSSRHGTSRSNFTSLTSHPTTSGNNSTQQQQQNTNSNSGSSESQNDLFVKSYRVSVTFDRCKIISVSCTCDSRDIFWCEHVVALIIYRIRNPKSIDLRVPISETLLQLDRQQLQKLVQYIIAEHHAEVIPTAQRLADEITQSVSTINKIQGAPDPTAGASADDEHIWHLDENQVSERVRSYLNSINSNSKDTAKHINALFDKVKEMLRARDSNGSRMLRLITEQFLNGATRNDKCRPLWDQLVSLWVVVILNPHCEQSERKRFRNLLIDWSHLPKCPQEDVEFRSISNYVTGVKRKASDLSDDEDDGEESLYMHCSYYATYNHSNNYPAHMATHNHRSSSNHSNYYFMRSYQPILPPSFPQYLSPHLLQMPPGCVGNNPCGYQSNFSKGRDCHQHPHHQNSTYSYAKSRLPQYNLSHRNVRPPSSYNASCRSMNGSRSDAALFANQARSSNSGNNSGNQAPEVQQGPKSIFQRAIDVSDLTWDDPHLRLILESDAPVESDSSKMHLFDYKGYPLWLEPVPVACARVEALKSHGYKQQSLRLAVSIVRTLKRHQEHWEICGGNCNSTLGEPMMCNLEGWIGHPFDPIGSLFDTLLEASMTTNKEISDPCCDTNRCSCMFGLNMQHPFAGLPGALMFPDLSSTFDHYPHPFDLPNFSAAPNAQSSSSTSRRLLNNPSNTHKNSQYHHVPVPGCHYQKDSYLTLAIEAALIALGQHRAMPSNGGAHEKAIRQEESLISKLQEIEVESDSILIEVLRRQVGFILSGGPFANSCCNPISDPAPLHTYALYLFNTLIGKDPELAYQVGIYALKIPIMSEDTSNGPDVFVPGNMHNGHLISSGQRSINYSHIQAKQLSLAESMLKTAKDDRPNNCLKLVYDASVENIRIPSNLFKLAKAASNAAVQSVSKYPSLQKKAFKLGQHVLKMTMAPTAANGKTRRDVIAFIVKCAVALGFEDVIDFMRRWPDYLTPIEAVDMVANNFSSQMPMHLTREQKVRLDNRIRDLSLECAERDPSNCALSALNLCDHDKTKFEQAFNIVIEAGQNGKMDSNQLIKVADYMDKKNQTSEAYEIALVAIESLEIPFNVDSSASVNDINRTCELARSMHGFDKLIPKLINNVQCAPVLSDIYKKYRPDPVSDIDSVYMGDGQHQPTDYTRKYAGCLLTKYHAEQKLWEKLLQAAITAYGQTTRTRLINISPRHYGEFIDFLDKARNTFLYAPDGQKRFMELVQSIKKNYKTKKKLMERLKARFDI